MNLYLYKYNNYYNRIVKKEEYLSEYPTPLQAFSNINFNPNDGIDTEHIFNYTGDQPDYCIVADSDNNIVSRWFVIEAARTRTGQYKITLHRDVMADYYDSVVTSPMFIEKATLSQNDPMIFNKENITFNQIKTSETLLKDETGCAWICGYIPRDYGGGSLSFSATVIPDITVDELSNWEYYSFKDTYKNYSYNDHLLFKAWVTGGYVETPFAVQANILETEGIPITTTQNPSGSVQFFYKDNYNLSNLKAFINSNLTTIRQQFEIYKSELYTSISENDYNTVTGLAGKIIYESNTNKYYKISIDEVDFGPSGAYVSVLGGFRTYLNNLFNSWDKKTSGNPLFELAVFGSQIKIILDEVPFGNFNITIPDATHRDHLKDAPYDMFCIPYSKTDLVQIKNTGASSFNTISISGAYSINSAQGIAEQIGKDNIYDLQLLPYCPMTGFEIEDNVIDINAQNSNRFTLITNDSSVTVGVILWATASSGVKTLEKDEYKITVEDKKLSNECDVYRLVSPNFNGQFEFSAAKNNGVDRFYVNYTYLPYNPYIRVAPNFKNLYGQEFKDARGLICQGDFSISYLSDAWINYQVQNKNYQNIFDRQIQNMEINQQLQRTSDIINAVVGSLSGSLSGATSGGLIGGAAGAGIGAGVGFLASAAGGIGDIWIGDKLRNEALDYTKDQFGYQLGNIQALPDSIAKTTAYVENNKIFPILEYYTCTDIEKQALKDKLKYNGMTVMRVGNIQEFLKSEPSYIKGKLIRNESISEDYHLLNAIAGELDKGVFI